MTYSGLILDFGGVVTTDFYGALSAFSQRAGLNPGAFTSVLRDTGEGRHALAAVECGRMTQREFERTMGRLLGLDDNGLLGNALADLRPRPEVAALVEQARWSGVKVAVLSNSWGSGSYDPYADYELERLFDAVVISDQVGLRKPSAEIYELTASKIGLPFGRCLFVDDTPANLPPAAALGMGTVLFSGADDEIAEIARLVGVG
jgi:putative hydrolase of the HAD superfamily